MATAKCSCGYSGEFAGFSERNIEFTDSGNITKLLEIGIECPDCKKWFHSNYLNDELLKLQDILASPDANKSHRLKYNRKYKKLQDNIRIKFGVEPPRLKADDKE